MTLRARKVSGAFERLVPDIVGGLEAPESFRHQHDAYLNCICFVYNLREIVLLLFFFQFAVFSFIIFLSYLCCRNDLKHSKRNGNRSVWNDWPVNVYQGRRDRTKSCHASAWKVSVTKRSNSRTVTRIVFVELCHSVYLTFFF